MNKITMAALLLLFLGTASAQSISSETVTFQLLRQPKEVIDANSRNFKVTVTSPYNLTADEVISNAKADYDQALQDYDQVVKKSETDYQQKLKDYDSEVAKAKQKYELESTEFKKLSMVERLSMTEQKTNPKLVLPSRPAYYKPAPPVYYEPNLADYTIVDNNVLASQIGIAGFTRGAGFVDIKVDIKNVNFQDNAGQTFANQPTKLVVKVNGAEKVNTSFFDDYTFLSSAPSNNINKALEEKNHLNKVIQFLNDYLNATFGYAAVAKTVKIESVKNKGKYDDLAHADIYVTTNLKKLQPEQSEINDAAFANMQKGIDIWTKTLTQIDYKNPKSDFNQEIARFVYFNLIRLNIALGKRAEAEKHLNDLQENLIYIKLSSGEQDELNRLEKEIYALKK